jgi:hypothetical protein
VTKRIEHNTHSHVRDLLGFVILCYPDNFPDDDCAEYGPQNMQEAFEDLHKGFNAIRAKSSNKPKIDRLSEMVKEAEELHNAGDSFGCSQTLQRVRYAMDRSGKAAEALMASGPRPQDEVGRLVSDSVAIARESLRDTGKLVAFARVLLDDGTTEQFEVNVSEQELYEKISASITNTRAVAVTTKGRHKAQDHTRQLEVSLIDYDAIMIDCDHREYEAYTFVLPYRFSSLGFEEVRTHKAPKIKARKQFFPG